MHVRCWNPCNSACPTRWRAAWKTPSGRENITGRRRHASTLIEPSNWPKRCATSKAYDAVSNNELKDLTNWVYWSSVNRHSSFG